MTRQTTLSQVEKSMEKSLSYQIFNDLLDGGHHQDEEKRHQGGPATSGRHIGDLLGKIQRWEIFSVKFWLPKYIITGRKNIKKKKSENKTVVTSRENTVRKRFCQYYATIDL